MGAVTGFTSFHIRRLIYHIYRIFFVSTCKKFHLKVKRRSAHVKGRIIVLRRNGLRDFLCVLTSTCILLVTSPRALEDGGTGAARARACDPDQCPES
jgi:hypothetical protein